MSDLALDRISTLPNEVIDLIIKYINDLPESIGEVVPTRRMYFVVKTHKINYIGRGGWVGQYIPFPGFTHHNVWCEPRSIYYHYSGTMVVRIKNKVFVGGYTRCDDGCEKWYRTSLDAIDYDKWLDVYSFYF